jgi:hypothetical protein
VTYIPTNLLFILPGRGLHSTLQRFLFLHITFIPPLGTFLHLLHYIFLSPRYLSSHRHLQHLAGSTNAIQHLQYLPLHVKNYRLRHNGSFDVTSSSCLKLHCLPHFLLQTYVIDVFQRSRGQGHSRSRNTGASNVVQMLMSRSLSGLHLPIRIHQHFGQRLHLVWIDSHTDTTFCMEYYFFMVGEMMDFCHQLTRGGAVNIASCVPCPHMAEELLQFFELKLDQCPILPPTDVELGPVGAPLSWRKCEQKCRFPPTCGCNVTSYHCIDWE